MYLQWDGLMEICLVSVTKVGVTSVECCFENVLLKSKRILLGKMKKNLI
jgi:hypothetical protein